MHKTNTKTTPTNNNTKTIKNWHEYNRALEQRGNILLCIEEDFARGKFKKPFRDHTVGRPKEYSDALIELILTIRALYHLPLRQVVGFIKFFFKTMGIQIPIPCYTTLSIRASKLNVKLLCSTVHKYSKQGVVLCLDSSGFKIGGEGEWKVRKHGAGKRRTWLETHIAIDYHTRDIIGLINTPNDVHDNTQMLPLLAEAERSLRAIESNRPLECIIGDGAYDSRQGYELASSLGATFIAPPKANATVHYNIAGQEVIYQPAWKERDLAVIDIILDGMEAWKVKTGYHRRSLVENVFFRLKTIFGDKINYRTEANRGVEQLIRAKLINQFNELGLPRY